MSSQSFYNIAFKGLSEGKHVFEYEIEDKFFSEFDGDIFDEGNVKVSINI